MNNSLIIYGENGEEKLLLVFSAFDRNAGWRKKQCFKIQQGGSVYLDQDNDILYSAGNENGTMCVLVRDECVWKQVQSIGSGVAKVSFMTMDSKRRLWVCGSDAGLISVWKTTQDGRFDQKVTVFGLPGTCGPNRDLQLWSSPEEVLPLREENWVWISDSGRDSIYTYRINETDDALELLSELKVRPGVCPCHMLLDEERKQLYVLTKGIKMLLSCRYDEAGTLSPRQMLLLAIGDDVTQEIDIISCHMAENGQFLYVGIAGSDRFTIYAIDRDGMLHECGSEMSGGTGLHCVAQNGPFLYALHEDGQLASFEIQQNGMLLRKEGNCFVSGMHPLHMWSSTWEEETPSI